MDAALVRAKGEARWVLAVLVVAGRDRTGESGSRERSAAVAARVAEPGKRAQRSGQWQAGQSAQQVDGHGSRCRREQRGGADWVRGAVLVWCLLGTWIDSSLTGRVSSRFAWQQV